MRKRSFLPISWIITILFAGCVTEGTMPDPVDSRLPAYSEEGNNLMAALLDGELWTSRLVCGASFVPDGECDDTFILRTFTGPSNGFSFEMQGSVAFDSGTRPVALVLELYPLESPLTSFEELTRLEGRELAFDPSNPSGTGILNVVTGQGSFPFTGKMFIRKAERQPDGNIIFSGTFGGSSAGGPTVTNGRFDYLLQEPFHFEATE